MDLRTLRYFTVAAQELNITRAAQKLHMSQPPLSHQLRLLEEELAPLFRHCPAGMLDMPEGEDLQDLLDEARYLCLDMLEGK